MWSVIRTIPLVISGAAALHISSQQEVRRSLSNYSYTHAYTPTYSFDRRDGWEDASVSRLSSKRGLNQSGEIASQAPENNPALVRRSKNRQGKGARHTVKNVVDIPLKGIGNIEDVTITWYTGKDLENPSCWHKSVWTPTDDSFACAVTLEGWTNRPECFKFLELCNTHNKCVFVRVVDTCAGCAKGSKHVDLTKAAFSVLANLDDGKVQVKMRLATDPKEWRVALWGPRVL